MKTDKDSRNIIIAVIVMILLALTMYIIGAKSSNAAAAEVSKPQVEQKDITYEELIHAYNMVLHRVLIDRPSYFEDVLVESPEYCRLHGLLFDEDIEEIYEFTGTDSVDYMINTNAEIQGEPTSFVSRYE